MPQTDVMNKHKQHLKLIKTMTKADVCVDRNTAKKLISKAHKIQQKLDKHADPFS